MGNDDAGGGMVCVVACLAGRDGVALWKSEGGESGQGCWDGKKD